MGTPEFAVPSLRAVASSCAVLGVVTQPDRPRGRGRALASSAIALAARELRLEVMQPEQVNDASWRERLAALKPDLFAVVAYGAILSRELLAVPRLGSINLHGSLLPDYRGASPVQRALWDGRIGTGVTVLWMDEGIDTGDLLAQLWAPIVPDDDAGSLARRLAEIGGPLLAEALVLATTGRAPRHPQERDAGSYARKLGKSDGVIDWSLDAVTVWCRQRAVTPWPGASTALDGKSLLVTRCRPHHAMAHGHDPGEVVEILPNGVIVACGRGALRIEWLKPEGRGEMAAAEWARGARVGPGRRLSATPEVTR